MTLLSAIDLPRSSAGLKLLAVGVGLTVIVIVLSIVKSVRRRRKADPVCQQRALFQELCAAHQLTRPQRQLLQSLSTYAPPADPALLFVRPDLFDYAYDQWRRQSEPPDEAGVVYLRQRLFHDDAV